MLALLKNRFRFNSITALYKQYLFLAWFLGICFGIFICSTVQSSFCSLMRASLSGSVSIVWVLVTALFPYFLYFTLHRAWGRLVLICTCFFKAFTYSFSLFALFYSFDSAGWLVCILCLWYDAALAVILFWFLGNLEGNVYARKRKYALSVVVTFMLICINHYFVRPIWIDLL